MQSSRLPRDQAVYRRFLAAVDDSALGDDLLRALVESNCLSPSAHIASSAIGAAVSLAAYRIAGGVEFLVYAFTFFAIGVLRTRLAERGRRRLSVATSRDEILAVDRALMRSGAAFAFLVGLTVWSLLWLPESEGFVPPALAMTAGFSLAFVTRSSGRLNLVLAQLLALNLPTALACATAPIANGQVIGALALVMVAAVIVLARAQHAKIVQLFKTSDQNRRLARTDVLTGLMNRVSFSEALQAALRESGRRAGETLALLAVDLDRFKEINDLLGHNIGDAVIVEAGARLRRAAGAGAAVARIGGDEFMLLVRSRDEGRSAQDLAQRIVAAMTVPFMIESWSLPTSASVGIALFPHHGSTEQDLLKTADIALYEAKRGGRNTARLFEPEMRERLRMTRALEVELRQAVAQGQFEAWYQPIQDLLTGRPDRYEALARWRHPERGLIAPDQFIPLAEQTGAIIEIGEQILRQACLTAAGWPAPLSVSVNLSPTQFKDPAALIATVKDALAESGLPPSRLELEITESVLMNDSQAIRQAVRELIDIGVAFSLDDFGAGYSSLAYLQDYPFAKVKIDRRFISDIETNRTSAAIVASVGVLAAYLGMDIVAEGVETVGQEAALRRLGIRRAQGYLYGRPAPQALETSLLAKSA